MKNTKTVVNASIALAFVLFSSIQLSAMEPQLQQLKQLEQTLKQAEDQAFEKHLKGLRQKNLQEAEEAYAEFVHARAERQRVTQQILDQENNG